MNKLFNATMVVLLAALGAGGVLYADKNCAKKRAELQQNINSSVAQYIDSNTPAILEKMAKTENFGTVIKSFSSISDEEINNRIKDYLQNNPAVLEEYIRNNASFIAATVLETDEYRNAAKSYAAPAEGNAQAEETATSDENQKFRDRWEEIIHNEAAPFAGPSDAPITVVEFLTLLADTAGIWLRLWDSWLRIIRMLRLCLCRYHLSANTPTMRQRLLLQPQKKANIWKYLKA